jgi:transcription antitermination factor NusG
MSQWYAIRTNSRQERTVAAGLAERGFTFFLPMETDWRGSPKVKNMEPLLPGYVFVYCGDQEFADLHGLEGVNGVVRYMRDDGLLWPMPFPSAEILRFQIDERGGAFDRTRNVKPPRYNPKKGERVQITAGAYLGYFARVLSAPTSDRRRLMIEGFEKSRHRTENVGHLAAA